MPCLSPLTLAHRKLQSPFRLFGDVSQQIPFPLDRNSSVHHLSPSKEWKLNNMSETNFQSHL